MKKRANESSEQKIKRLDSYKSEKVCVVEGCNEKFLGGAGSKYCLDHKKLS